MEPAASLAAFVQDPIGRYLVAGTSVVWCVSSTLGGATTWGAPDAETARQILAPYAALWSPSMAEEVDVLLDGRRIERIDPDALGVLLAWLGERRAATVRKVRQQVGVIAEGLMGITLSGILPTVGETHPFRVVTDLHEAHRRLGGDPALADEIECYVDQAIGTSIEVRRLRDLLRGQHVSIGVDDAARALNLSTRSLQRALNGAGTSFQRELRDARFAEASSLLVATSDKVATVAARVGITESALTQMFRDRTGKTPAEFRAAQR
ncbi:MAG: helix-turn-helix transcriptional regulator [Myxococcales bacterium]|nr:helix-turn-helix transcriptional regulator [Myxococcales bacterium]